MRASLPCLLLASLSMGCDDDAPDRSSSDATPVDAGSGDARPSSDAEPDAGSGDARASSDAAPFDSGFDDAGLPALCDWAEDGRFDAPPDGNPWRLSGSAQHLTGGVIQLTDDGRFRKGGLFNVARKVNPGDLVVSFRFQIEPNQRTPPADGMALSIIDAADVAELDEILAAAIAGGGLGYSTRNFGANRMIRAVHFEIDTWFNPGVDPVVGPHVALTADGDAQDHRVNIDFPSAADGQWHELEARLRNGRASLWIDGVERASGDLPTSVLQGGYVGVTGTTGDSVAFHRIDDIRIRQRCVP